MNVQSTIRLPPSLLARKILCVAYVPAPFSEEDRFRFQALHAVSMIRVIARHLRAGYRLIDVERRGRGYIIDLLFEAASTGRRRLNEVKSSKTIREVHRIQAALYAALSVNRNIDEIAISNKETDEVLSSDFIERVQRQVQLTRQLITSDPIGAATRYTPHEDCCYTCANPVCVFRRQPASEGPIRNR